MREVRNISQILNRGACHLSLFRRESGGTESVGAELFSSVSFNRGLDPGKVVRVLIS